jgi:PAS domain S-box-containing protein
MEFHMAAGKGPKKDVLRQRAEKLLSGKSRVFSKIENRDGKKLVHELQVHQVEPEMQNDELRRAQEEIEESRRKYSDLYDFSPLAYFTFSQSGEIVEVNLTGASLLGMDRGKLLHRPFSAFVDPEFRSLFRDHRLNVLKSGQGERCELKLTKKDGESFYVFLRSIVVPHGQSFRIRSAVGDITELKKAQEKAETEHAFRIAIENSILSGIAAVDLEGRQSYVNISFCRMVGRSEEELLGKKPPFAYWPPEELDHLNRVFQTIMNAKAPRESIQLRLMRKNGERFEALVLTSALKDHQGKVIGWIGTFGDITHLKGMEKELRQLNTQLEERARQRTAELETVNQQLRKEINERKKIEQDLRRAQDELETRVQERTAELAKSNEELRVEIAERLQVEKMLVEQSRVLRGFFTSTITPLVFLDRDFNFIRVNEAYAKTCQRNISEFEGHNHFEFYPDAENEAIFRKVIETKKPFQAFAKPFVFPDHPEWGETYWDWTLTPLLGDRGEVEFLVFSLRDVTERRRAEKALRAASLYARNLIEASLDPLVTISPEGKIMDVNKSTEIITGVSRDFLIGSDFSGYFTDPNRAREGYRQVFREGLVRDYPLAIRHTSGQVTEVFYNAAVYKNEVGEVQGVFAAARDISERKRAEKALAESEKQLRHLSFQLMATQEIERKRVARELHDGLGQSLTAIKFRVESFLQEIGESSIRTKARTLEAVIPMVQESVREIRRIQTDLRPSILDDLGILATISWVCREYQATYPHVHMEKQVAIEEPDVPESLKMVIYRIIQEALNNISKHSRADRVHLALRKNKGELELSIQDNGRGFDLPAVLSRQDSGQGLGLVSMRERAEHSGGSLVIESAKDKGTTLRAIWTL